MPHCTDAPLRGAIVAMTRDNVIGINGRIPWHYSTDLKRFRRRTIGKNVVMGRLTWESIGRRPLPGRRNIVVGKHPADGVEWYPDIRQVLALCARQDTWIIGGGQVYRAALDWVTLLDVTYVPDRIPTDQAVLFPAIDPALWRRGSATRCDQSGLESVIFLRR